MLHPDDVDVGSACFLDDLRDVGNDVGAVVRTTDNAVLYVDDEQRGLGSVVERRHDLNVIAGHDKTKEPARFRAGSFVAR